MQMHVFNTPTPNRDGSLDGDVFLHEMTHGLSNGLHSNGSGLAINQSRGMGEGWSDFYARCLLATTRPDSAANNATEDPNAVYASGAYVTCQYGSSTSNCYSYGIRRFPCAVISNVGSNGKPHNPEIFTDVDPVQIDLSNGAHAPNPIFGTSSATEVHNIGEVRCSMLLEMRAPDCPPGLRDGQPARPADRHRRDEAPNRPARTWSRRATASSPSATPGRT